MSVEIYVRLTTHTTIEDLATAIAFACGCKKERAELSGGSFSARCREMKLEHANVRTCYHLIFNLTESMRKLGVESEQLRFFLHSEMATEMGFVRGLLMPQNAINLAIAKKLVDCFGGFIECGNTDSLIYTKPTKRFMSADDGVRWEHRQRRLLLIAPVKAKDLTEFNRYLI